MRESYGQYRAFVLRCWCDDAVRAERVERVEPESTPAAAEAPPSWHFTVTEITHEQRRRGLPNLEALITFLQGELTGSGQTHRNCLNARR